MNKIKYYYFLVINIFLIRIGYTYAQQPIAAVVKDCAYYEDEYTKKSSNLNSFVDNANDYYDNLDFKNASIEYNKAYITNEYIYDLSKEALKVCSGKKANLISTVRIPAYKDNKIKLFLKTENSNIIIGDYNNAKSILDNFSNFYKNELIGSKKQSDALSDIVMVSKFIFAMKTENDLRSDLTATQTDLTATKADLATTKTDLAVTKTDLAATKKDLATAKTDLAATKTDLAATKGDLATVKTDLAATKKDLATTRTDLATAKADLAAANVKLQALESAQKKQPSSPPSTQPTP